MATRTVTALFYNNTSNSLTLTSSSTQGTWVIQPPTNINAFYSPPSETSGSGSPVEQVPPSHWKTSSPVGGGNASGTVTYQINGTSLYLTLSWNSIDGKPNSYPYTTPTGYAVGVSASGDVDATVTYTFTTNT